MTRVLAVVVLLLSAPAAAQTNTDRLPWFVVDAHAATVGLPQAEGWVPDLTGTPVFPGRNWGIAGGATVYPFRMGRMTIGVGASLIAGRGSADTVTVTGSGSTAVETVTAVVHTAATSLAPQLSLNFGRRLGWSYISAGIGRTKVSSRSDAIGTTLGVTVPSAWNQALNFGGGARWFMKPRLGAGFDVRFVQLGSRSPTAVLASARRTRMWNISAGISIQ